MIKSSRRAARPSAPNEPWMTQLLRDMRGRRIAVIGDLMLDEWYWGNVRRISPEAPVPVVEVRVPRVACRHPRCRSNDVAADHTEDADRRA